MSFTRACSWSVIFENLSKLLHFDVVRVSQIKNNLVDARVPLLVIKHETPRCDICIRESPRNAYRVALIRYFLEFSSSSSDAHGAADCDGDVDMSDGNGTIVFLVILLKE